MLSGLALFGNGGLATGSPGRAAPSAGAGAGFAMLHGPSGLHAPLWTKLTPTHKPSNRDQVQMAYDPALGEVVLFGGYFPTVAAAGDTWSFHGGQWTSLTGNLTQAPAARWGAGFAFDRASQSLILFGGRSTSTFFNDTWSFNATGWHRLSTPTAPSPRNHMAFAYDVADHYLLLFGGGMGNAPIGSGSPWSYYNDTWAFQHGHWKNITRSVVGAPPPHYSVAAAFDPHDGAVLLQGGGVLSASGTVVPDGSTFSFAAGTYHNVSSTPTPGPLYAPALAWDPGLGKAIVFGENTTTTADPTFGYRAGVWTNLTPTASASPATRGNVGLAYDAADGYLVLFGGDTPPPNYSYRSDTWIFR